MDVDGAEQLGRLLVLQAVQLRLFRGEVDAEAAVHAGHLSARLHAIIPRLLGGGDDESMLLQIGGEGIFRRVRGGEDVGLLPALLVQGQRRPFARRSSSTAPVRRRRDRTSCG